VAVAPRYQVINRDLSGQIGSGSLGPGDRLPSESELAQHYGVSRMTVRQAVGQLEAEGLVVRRHGTGTFVSEHRPRRRRANRFGSFAEEMGVEASDVTSRLLEQEVGLPPEDIVALLQLSPGQAAVRVYRLRLVSGEPVSLQDSWLPLLLAPSLARGGLEGGSLYRTLRDREGVEVTRAEQEVSASLATPEQAQLLAVEPGSPLIAILRVAYAGGDEVVEVARSLTVPTLPLSLSTER